jgi:MFS family permease
MLAHLILSRRRGLDRGVSGDYQNMQQLAGAQADLVDVRPQRRQKTSERRKVTVRLSEGVCGRLDVASDRPGVGKSMLVEAALEHFLNPTPSVEALLRERLDGIHARFDHLERDMRIIAETVALHARYHLTVVPPLPESRQREAVVLGDERFKVLAEQVDRRVRLGRPLMQETINRLNSVEQEGPGPTTGEESGHNSQRARKNPNASPGGVDLEQTPPASAKTARGNPTFAQHPKVTSRANTSGEELNPRVTQNTDPKSATARLEAANEKPLSKWRMILSVFLPFAAGYYLSFLFRTINASISPVLASDFGLGAAETGLLASVYFLVFAGAQIPVGVLLDRYGPRRVQSVLLVIAVGGATLFGNADSFVELLVGRAMIGLGVAASLMAGLKAIVVWFPRDRVAFVNGGMIMLGSLGAVTATTPTDWLLSWIGWRSLFEVLTIATLATAGLIYFAVPKSDRSSKGSVSSGKPLTLRSIFSDPRFLRIAPLSATCIGSSWAMHSLWAASWLADVEGFDRQGVINQLFTMAIGISLGSIAAGNARGSSAQTRHFDRSSTGSVWRTIHVGRARPDYARATAIDLSLVDRISCGSSYRTELCDHRGLLSRRNRRSCQWRSESVAFRLGIRSSIRNRTDRQPMGAARGTLSVRLLSDCIWLQPRASVRCSVVVHSTLAPALCQIHRCSSG